MVGHGRLSRSKRFTPDKPWTNGGADNVMSSNKRFVVCFVCFLFVFLLIFILFSIFNFLFVCLLASS